MGACTKAALAPHAAATAHRRPLTEPRHRHRPSPADGAATAPTTRRHDAAPYALSAQGRRQHRPHRPRQRHRCCPGPAAARRRCRTRRRGSPGPPPRAPLRRHHEATPPARGGGCSRRGHAEEDRLDASRRDSTDALDGHRQAVRPPVQVASGREDRLPSHLRDVSTTTAGPRRTTTARVFCASG